MVSLFVFFGLLLYVPVNSYGHVETVYLTGKLDYVVNQYFVHILSLVTDTNPY